MRKIKFRGIAATDGRVVYGTGAYVTAGFECVVSNMIYIHCKEGSVSQLVGVDCNGNEVYEGDIIKPVHAVGSTFNRIATMCDIDDLEEGDVILAKSLTEGES